jgi:hypothetical protein
MHLTLFLGAGKPLGQSLMAADDMRPTTSRRLFVRDKVSGMQFLVDTGLRSACSHAHSSMARAESLTTYFPRPIERR